MRSQSPWSIMLLALFMLGFAIWNSNSGYNPPDSTPLHVVEGSIGNVSTSWIYHSSKHGHWYTPVVSLVVSDGTTVRMTAHSRDESPAVQSLANLRPGSMMHAQVDASWEIWELTDDGNAVVTLDSTLARHRQLRNSRRMVSAFMLLLGFVFGFAGFKQLRDGGNQ